MIQQLILYFHRWSTQVEDSDPGIFCFESLRAFLVGFLIWLSVPGARDRTAMALSLQQQDNLFHMSRGALQALEPENTAVANLPATLINALQTGEQEGELIKEVHVQVSLTDSSTVGVAQPFTP